MYCFHGLVPYDERTAATRELEVRKCGSDMPGFQSDAAFTGGQPPSPRSGAASCSFARAQSLDVAKQRKRVIETTGQASAEWDRGCQELAGSLFRPCQTTTGSDEAE